MTEYVLAGAAVALISLIFSELPFIQLVYFLAITQIVDWSQFSVITGLMIIAMLGGSIAKKLR